MEYHAYSLRTSYRLARLELGKTYRTYEVILHVSRRGFIRLETTEGFEHMPEALKSFPCQSTVDLSK